MLQKLPVAEQVFGQNKAPMGEVLALDFADIAKDAAALIAAADKLPKTIKTDTELGDFGQVVTRLRALAGTVDGTRKDEGKPLLEATRDLNAWFNELKAGLDGARTKLETVASDYQRAKEAAKRAEAAEAARKLREQEDAARLKAAESSGTTAARAEGKADNLASAADRHEAAAGAKTADLVRTNVGGVTASAKSVWTFRIKDYEALAATMGPLGPYLAQGDVEKAIRSLVKLRKSATTLPGVEVFEDTKATFR